MSQPTTRQAAQPNSMRFTGASLARTRFLGSTRRSARSMPSTSKSAVTPKGRIPNSRLPRGCLWPVPTSMWHCRPASWLSASISRRNGTTTAFQTAPAPASSTADLSTSMPRRSSKSCDSTPGVHQPATGLPPFRELRIAEGPRWLRQPSPRSWLGHSFNWKSGRCFTISPPRPRSRASGQQVRQQPQQGSWFPTSRPDDWY